MFRIIPLIMFAIIFVQNVFIPSVFSQVNTATTQQQAEQSDEEKQTIRQREENGLNLARQAILLADPYPGLKKSVKMKGEQIQELTKRKTAIQAMIQRTKIELNKKTSEFANNPHILEIARKLYTKKMNELKQELAEIDTVLPGIQIELTEDTIELQAEELVRVKEKNASGEMDDIYEKAVMDRFQHGAQLLDSTNLDKP
ncbi:MAG: hypothetical protein E3K32_03315 [wastewater metagenome]|nr:hypothetical protein [Candidatus Loosdrechtia aerotolerans]